MTGLFDRFVLVAAVAVVLGGAARDASAETGVVTPAEAIERAVAERISGDFSIEVTSLDTIVQAERALHAMPEPGGRSGAPMRFVMMVGHLRRGVAVATVTVLGSYARAARHIERNERIASDAIEIVDGELPPVAFKRLPIGEDVIGLTARRDIAPGEPLTQAVLQVPPMVRAGDSVVLTVVVGTVQVTAIATASVSGHEGDVIRVVPEGGRSVKARITAPGAVEIVQ